MVGSPINFPIVRHSFPVNGQDPVIHLLLHSEGNPPNVPRTGLSIDSNYAAYALSPQNPTPVALTLTAGQTAEGGCCFWEIDSNLMPGLYGLQIPSAFRCEGFAFLYLSFPYTHPLYVEIQGVCYDPYDSFALGLETWIRSSCHENLTSGLRKSMPAVLRPLLTDLLAHTGKE
jgi:hypothetical protein